MLNSEKSSRILAKHLPQNLDERDANIRAAAGALAGGLGAAPPPISVSMGASPVGMPQRQVGAPINNLGGV